MEVNEETLEAEPPQGKEETPSSGPPSPSRNLEIRVWEIIYKLRRAQKNT